LKLDFLISASPNAGFFSQIAFFRLCLNALGGDYAKARLVAVFGDHDDEIIPDNWLACLEGTEVVWAHAPGEVNPCHRAQHDRRFEVIRKDADLAILCDADVVLMRPINDLVQSLVARPALAGVIAYLHFPWKRKGRFPFTRKSRFPWIGRGRLRDPSVEWREIAKAAIGRDIDRPYRYTFLDENTPPTAPFYINYGMFAGPPKLLETFYQRDRELRSPVAELIGHWWAPQVSLALTCADLELPTLELPMRYNFPNLPEAEQLHPEEARNVVFLHYLQTESFDRTKVFASESNFDQFVGLKLEGSNRIFQEHVIRITDSVYPFRS